MFDFRQPYVKRPRLEGPGMGGTWHNKDHTDYDDDDDDDEVKRPCEVRGATKNEQK